MSQLGLFIVTVCKSAVQLPVATTGLGSAPVFYFPILNYHRAPAYKIKAKEQELTESAEK